MWKNLLILFIFFPLTYSHTTSFQNSTTATDIENELQTIDRKPTLKEIFMDTATDFSNCSAPNNTANRLHTDCTLCSCATRAPRISTFLTIDCEVTEEVLQRLLNLIWRAWEILTIPGEAENFWSTRSDTEICSSMISSKSRISLGRKSFSIPQTSSSLILSPFCEDLLEDMEELIVALTEHIRLLIISLDDPAILWPKIAQLESCIACLNRQMSDIEVEYGQKFGNLTQQLVNMKHCFTLEIRRQVEKISELEQRLDAKSINVISANIIASNHTAAVIEFLRLKNYDLMAKLIEDNYDSQLIENILTFGMLVNFNNASRRAQIFEQVQTLMDKDLPSRDIHKLIFYKFLNDDTKHVCNEQELTYCLDLPTAYFNIVRNAKEGMNQTITNWAAAIRQSNYKSLWIIISPEDKVTLAGEAFQDILRKVILKAVDENVDRNLKNTLDFVSGLRWNKQKLLGFKTLLESVGSNAHGQIAIAAKMKVAMESLSGPDGKVDDILDQFLILKGNLAQHVMHIIWGNACNIRGRKGDCLACNNGLEASNASPYFTTNCNLDTSKWKLLPIKVSHEVDGILFKFQNIGNSRYLGSHIPWKTSGMSFGVVACSTQDFGEYPDKHYLWRLRLKSNSYLIELHHVGRNGFVSSTMEIVMHYESEGYYFEISCTGVN